MDTKELLAEAKTFLKETEEEIKTNMALRSTLAQTERLVKALLYQPGETERILTRWADVNETYELAGKGPQLRAEYKRNKNVLNLMFTLLKLAAAFPPVAAKVKPVVKAVNTAIAAVKEVAPKPIADMLPEPIEVKAEEKVEEKPVEKAKVKKGTAAKKSTAKSKGKKKSKLSGD